MNFAERKQKVERLLRLKYPISWAPPPIESLRGHSGPVGDGEQHALLMRRIEADRVALMATGDDELRASFAAAEAIETANAELKAQVEEKGRFFSHRTADADFNYWAKAEYWTLDEAIALLLGKSPEMVNWPSVQSFVKVSAFAAQYARLRNLAMRSQAMNSRQSAIYPSSVLAWAAEVDTLVPEALQFEIARRAQRRAARSASATSAIPAPLRGTAHVDESNYPLRGPRWKVWGALPTIELWRAVVLSLDVEPEEKLQAEACGIAPVRPHIFSRIPREYFDRLKDCKRGLSVNGPIHPQGAFYSGVLQDPKAAVLMGEVAAFLRVAEYALPVEMAAPPKAGEQRPEGAPRSTSDEPTSAGPATPAADAPESSVASRATWAPTKPKRDDGLALPLYGVLKAARDQGQPRPNARDVLEAFRLSKPPGILEAMADEVKYFDLTGNTQTADLDNIRKRIERMTAR